LKIKIKKRTKEERRKKQCLIAELMLVVCNGVSAKQSTLSYNLMYIWSVKSKHFFHMRGDYM